MAWSVLLALLIINCSSPRRGILAQAASPAPSPDTEQSATSRGAAEPEASTVPDPPPVTAAAAYAVDVSSGTPLYALNADERLPPASLTKIVSAIVVIKHAKLDETVQIDESDVVDPEYSKMNVVVGDTLTTEQLLYGMLLPSGNDAAHALARTVGATLPGGDPGSDGDPVAAFVEQMNRVVASLHLSNTHFVNPAGEDADDQYASARDMARLAEEALKSKTLAKIVDTPSLDITSVGAEPQTYSLQNTNTLLGEDGVHGVKTGTTAAAGGCLISAAWFHGRNRVITVVLHSEAAENSDGILTSEARYDDTRAILDGLQRDYRWLSPMEANEIPGLEDEMAAWQVTLKSAAAVPIPTSELPRFRYRLRLGPEGAPKSDVGQVLFLVGATTVAERTLYQATSPADATAPVEPDSSRPTAAAAA